MFSSIALPHLHLASRDKQLEATLEPCLCLDLPESLGSLQSDDQLRQAIDQEHLWIARIGSCYLEVSVFVNGNLILNEDSIAKLAGWIQHCHVCRSRPLEATTNYRADEHRSGTASAYTWSMLDTQKRIDLASSNSQFSIPTCLRPSLRPRVPSLPPFDTYNAQSMLP